MKALALTGLLAAVMAVADEKVDAELKKFQGQWVATSLRHGTAETPQEVIDKGGVTLTIKGDHFTFKTPKETHEGQVILDPARKTIDLAIKSEEGRTKGILCIYEFKDEMLRIAGDQAKRPDDFDTKLGGAIVATFQRARK